MVSVDVVQADGFGHIPAAQRVQHLRVFGPHPVAVGVLAEVQGAVDVGGVPQLPQDAGEPRHAGGVEQREVETAVGLGQPREVARLDDRARQLFQ